jgi:uncharacterized membrane protein YdbT with pleckstrin-like domain
LIKGIWIFITISVVTALIIAIIHLIIILVNGDQQAISILWITTSAALLAMWAIGYPLLYLWIKNLEYMVTEDRVTIYKGILTKTKQNIPFRAITDFALVRTLYDRYLGIGSINIQTAGQHISSGSKYEGKLAGLTSYEQIHSELRDKLKILHPVSGPVPTGDAGKLPPGDVLKEILKELKEINKNLSGK